MRPVDSHPVAISAFHHLIWLSLLISLVLACQYWYHDTVPITYSLVETVNPNHADLARLVCLPGVGPQRAQAIIDDRTQQQMMKGNASVYTCPEDLLAIKGIGPGILRQITPYLRFDQCP